MKKYNVMNHTHYRTIPTHWPTAAHLGRTDISLDPLTDTNCHEVVYHKTGCFTVSISTEDLADALIYCLRDDGKHRFMLMPFTIDIDDRTVNGIGVPMNMIWDVRCTTAAT